MLRLRACAVQLSFAAFLVSAATCVDAQPRHRAVPSSGEARTVAAFERARQEGPLALRAFLYAMPKGGDLHSHLSGAVYAESWIRAAGEDGLCVDTAALAFVRRPKDPSAPPEGGCRPGAVPALSLPQNQHLYDELVDAFSMRTFVPTAGDSGHDHFFNSFEKFGGTSHAHLPEWVDEVAARAAAQNEQYLELMHTPDIAAAVKLAGEVGFRQDFPEYRKEMLARGLREQVPAIRAELDSYEREQHRRERCGTPQASPACAVTVRYIFQVLRNMSPEAVFGEILLGFEVAAAEPRMVGLNLVQPEDTYYSMRDYALHMQMIAALRPFYPQVKLALHAGELAPGMVPPDGLTFHIRSAVEIAHADRIGHGVTVMYEHDPYALLTEMAARHVLVEINLTSNDVILNIKGPDHPLPFYLRYRVPVALSTDDEGVSRIDLTHEYQRAAETYRLSYLELKQMARNSLEYSFLPGGSLWSAHDYSSPVAPCQMTLSTGSTTPSCQQYLGANPKAEQQRELERRFRAFESAQHAAVSRAVQPAGQQPRLVH